MGENLTLLMSSYRFENTEYLLSDMLRLGDPLG